MHVEQRTALKRRRRRLAPRLQRRRIGRRNRSWLPLTRRRWTTALWSPGKRLSLMGASLAGKTFALRGDEIVDAAERAKAQEARRNMDEVILTLLRDGQERPSSELLSVIEVIPLSFDGLGAMPDRLDEEKRQKAELNNAINRLKQVGVLQVQGTGAQK